MAPVSAMSPLYHIVRVLPSCPQRPRGPPWTISVPSVCRPYQRQSKSKAKCARCSAPFSLSLILPRSPTDAKPQTRAGVARRCASRRCESTTAGHPRVGLACLADVMHIFTAQLAFSLRSPWLRPSRSLITWSPFAITLGCPVYTYSVL